jgi:magnesium transporter
LGIVSLRKILTSPLDMKLSDLMTQNMKYVHPDAEMKEIAQLISKYDIIAVPVLDEEKRIRGVITVDDVIDLFIPNPTRRKKR